MSRLGIAFSLIAALGLAGCSSGPRCSPVSCTGCCDETDTCRAGIEDVACGVGGKLCFSCPSGNVCGAGSCQSPRLCRAANCAGCCNAMDMCELGTLSAACGKAGGACEACGTAQVCMAGACASDLDACTGNPLTVRTSDVQALLGAKCAVCHYPAMGGMAEGSGYAYADFTSATQTQLLVGRKSLYAGAVGLLKVVDPNVLANSSLWLKVSSTGVVGRKGPHNEATGAKAPQDGSVVTAQETQQIKDWICTGALP